MIARGMVTTIATIGAVARVSIAQGIAQGNQIQPLPTAPWVSKGEYTFVPNFQAKAITPSFNSSTVDTWGAAPSAAHPAPLVQISWASGGAAGPMADGSYIATPWIWYLSNAAGTKPKGAGLCCNGSVVAYVSSVGTGGGRNWQMRSEIASKQSIQAKFGLNVMEEGPNENDIVLLRDGKQLLCVIRVDGGDGTPHHYHSPYLLAT